MSDNQDTSTSEHLKERSNDKFCLLNDLTVRTTKMETLLAKTQNSAR